MNKPELLAPAGNFETVMAAINAGADAVYLGAEKFSARAFADNLSEEEICRAIVLCHLHDVKVYLTLNILLNSEEINEVEGMVRPLYDAGLDGVIVQDLGVASVLRRSFPGLALHASTQMSIMNDTGAQLFKEQGFERVVPARELTLDEVKAIKASTGLELECFIHGAMCYSYSGLCLMSSIIGGRSGNRGKCAGTCRLPFNYHNCVKGCFGEEYPLSMKDMCTLGILPKLIEAGIDSFKIEGRMKSPEYCAGVTAMYRKYIDMYFSSPKDYRVSDRDLDKLKRLYIRTDISSGYYEGIRGRKLLTMAKPGYNGNDEAYIAKIHEDYVKEPDKLPVDITCYMSEGEEVILTLGYGDICVSVSGGLCEKAQKAPLSVERISSQLSKLGDTPFIAENMDITLNGDIFVPMGTLNSLRREASDQLPQAILKSKGYRSLSPVCAAEADISENDLSEAVSEDKHGFNRNSYQNEPEIDVHIMDMSQLSACRGKDISRLYIEHDLIKDLDEDTFKDFALEFSVYISLPVIFRGINGSYYDQLKDTIDHLNESGLIKGLLIHSYDEYKWASDNFTGLLYVTDTSVYMHNHESIAFAKNELGVNSVILPYELKIGEYSAVASACADHGVESTACVYGRIPLMVSAGCLKKTYDICDHKDSYNVQNHLTDRYNHDFPVRTDCSICTNIIYNDRPLSLIGYTDALRKMKIDRFKINFTGENEDQAAKIIGAFCYGDFDGIQFLRETDTMSGHMKRGV